MRISESENIKTDLEKKEHVNFIEIHDRDYIIGNDMVDRIGEEFGSRSFVITLYNALYSDCTLTCKITYYQHEKCISQYLKRFIKKYKKFKKQSSVMLFANDSCSSSNHYFSQNSTSYFHNKMGGYMRKKNKVEVNLVTQENVYAELKRYIQFHPMVLQVIGDIENYNIIMFEYYTDLV